METVTGDVMVEGDDLSLHRVIVNNDILAITHEYYETYLPWVSAAGIFLNIVTVALCVLRFSRKRNGKQECHTNDSACCIAT